MKIGIIIAMDKEFRRISELLDGQKREEDGGRIFVMGRLGDNELVLHQCGIGKVNAAVGVSELIRRYSPDLVVSTGCAGGGRTDMEVKDFWWRGQQYCFIMWSKWWLNWSLLQMT